MSIKKINNKLEKSNKFKILSEYNKAMIEYEKIFNIGFILIIIILIINIIWCSFIVNYLLKIDSCNCYNEDNKLNYSNIQYLIIVLIILLIISRKY